MLSGELKNVSTFEISLYKDYWTNMDESTFVL